ncbi:MAG TPA: PilZ domain-containing protein [Kofleriaceae bacterium]|jgi:hypothetical protein
MDQRAAVRVPVRARAQARAAGLVIDGLVEDVSRSGLFMRAPRAVDEGAALELDLDLPGEDTLHLCAQVVRVEHEPRVGMALRFVGDLERNRRPLANFIMRQHATSR